MMGKRDPQKQLWNYQMNLDKRVRSDHPLRRVHETLELDFVRREVPKFYGTKGNVSEDQVVITKLMLLKLFTAPLAANLRASFWWPPLAH
jgi:hypothetical protein